jgi:glutaredoxin
MVLIVGNPNCTRCEMVKSVLDNKNIKYEYKNMIDFSSEEKSHYLELAEHAGQTSFPLIIQDNKLITLQEVN